MSVNDNNNVPFTFSLPDSIAQKYKETKHFNFLVSKNTDLQEDITNAFDIHEEINYQETTLEPNLLLSIFTLGNTVYDFVVRDKKVIFKDIASIYRAKRNFKYKDWNHDGKKDIVEYYQQCEAGCLGYSEHMMIYEVEKDTVLLTIQLPLKERVCYLSEKITSITTYTYKVNKSKISVKKTEGTRRDCNANDIQKVEAVTYKKFLLDTITDKFSNEF
ncbi:hypothetical protein [Capnocytophaga catalasegens]|uniref:hypothetical protein n=1 Tax=Capnocytophaga catalasegens TaxID=1004260 RepID=UPI002232C916|nr:hypothetical protein [Capnocytophaga catalasegens]